jgi:hypothetical protein
MKKRHPNSFSEFEAALMTLFNQFYDHQKKCIEQGQSHGLHDKS